MPSLNQGDFINDAIRSVISQDYPNLELIIIDGGSTDNTPEVIRKHESSLTFWVSEKDNGQSHAINKGIRKATGEIITWLNSDDQYTPGALRLIAGYFKKDPQLSVIHGRALVFGTGWKGSVKGPTQSLDPHSYLSYMRFPQPASFLSAQALQKAGYLDENLEYAMDYDLVARIVLLGGRILGIPDVLALYRMHSRSKSNDDLRFADEWGKVLLRILETIPAGNEGAQLLKAAGITKSDNGRSFEIKAPFTEHGLTQAAGEYLDLLFHINYRHFRKQQCVKILDVMNITKPDRSREYRRYIKRLQYIPRLFFRIYRNFAA